jgi:DNA invertase Pin-like site-specific DNA recombinase
MEDKKYKVAVYIRLARMDDVAEENQETMLRRFAEEQGHTTLAVYSDNGYSGLNFNRPAFMQMENDIRAGLINTVYLKDLTRISRNVIDSMNWLENKKQNGITVKSINGDVTNTPLIGFKELSRAFRKHRKQVK